MQWNLRELSAAAAVAVAIHQNIAGWENDIHKLFHFTFPFNVSTKKINQLPHTNCRDVWENLNQRKIA